MSAAGSSVLFDAPGPRARRRIRVATAVAAVVVVALLALVVWRLWQEGALAAELWRPLVDPRTEEFPVVWRRLGGGLLVTLQAAALALVLSLVIGVLIAVARLSLGRVGRLPLVGVVELLRGLPVIVTIYYVSVLLPAAGLQSEPFWYLVIGLIAYNSVIIAEIVRAGIASLPSGQTEAGLAVGLTRGQTMRLVQLPQAIRVMLPALISQFVVIVKDTALGTIVLPGIGDLLDIANQIRQPLGNPLQLLTVVGLVYVAVCLALDRLAQFVQRRLSQRTAGSPVDDDAHADQVVGSAVER